MHVRRLLILITLSIAALFLITFAFFSPSLHFSSHHQHHHDNEIKSSSTTDHDNDNNLNNKKQLDDSSSSNNNKPLLNFLQKEQLLLPPYDQQIFACYDLIVSTHGASTSIEHNNDEACQNYLSKHSKIIIDHQAQGIKWSTNSDNDSHDKLLLSQLFDSNHSSMNSFTFSSSSSSSSEKVLTDQRLYTHSKKMKSQAKMNFVKSSSSSSSFETYRRALESAVGKLAAKQQQQQQQREDNHHEETDNDDDEDVKYVQSIQSVMRERFDPDFKEHHPDLQLSGKDENDEAGNRNKKNNKKNSKNKRSHHQFNFILKLPQLDVADEDSRKVVVIEALVKFFEEHEEFLHKLISVFIEHDERVVHAGTASSHHRQLDTQKQKHQHRPHKMLINFVFVGLDDQQLLKEILKIFVQDRHKKEHCRIISSSNEKKAKTSRRRSTDDIVAVSCDNNDHHQYGENNEDDVDVHHSDEKHLAPHSLLSSSSTTTIDPSFFCDTYSPSSIDVKNALKFGTKTGVYTGYEKMSMIARKNNKKKQRNQQKLVLIKHYNLVQYVHGFGNGLHDFLASPFSFLHPSIVMPTGACAFVSSSSSSSTQALTKNNIDSLSTTENVFQFQPFIQKQMSLTKFMAHQRKLAKNYHQKNDNDDADNNKKSKKSSSSSSSFFGLLTWRDRLDLSLQLLCTFNFLHSHPDGPFSFDDNHPDQYLVVDNNHNNNNDHEEDHHNNDRQEQQQEGLSSSSSSSSLSFYTSSKARYLLKMVDIDTLQKATRNKRKLAIKTKNQQKKKSSPVRDPKIKFGENNNNNDNNNKNQNVDDTASANQYVLTCRCFYCRGRSNCLFVNSLEGYKSCGQYNSKDFGDEGNKEVLSSISSDIVVRSGDNDNEEDSDENSNKKKCTVLTDSWYLGQVLHFIGADGELLFPTMYSMKEVIEIIEKAVMKNEQNNGQELALSKIFPRVLMKKKKKNDGLSSIQHEFDKVVKKLLVDRISPREAAKMLLEIGTKKKGESDDDNVKDNEYIQSSFTEKDWCPMVYHHGSSDADVDSSSPFHGLKVAV